MGLSLESAQPAYQFNPIGSKVTCMEFAHTNDRIVTGHESGKVAMWDYKRGEDTMSNERAHADVITDLQFAPDRTYFITSSKDKSARVSFLFRTTKSRKTET